jgi:arginyl-tRNA synthetase
MDIESILKSDIVKAFQQLFDHELSADDFSLQPTLKEFEGSHTFVVFPYTKITKKSPEQAANAIGDYLIANCELVGSFNVVKGFLNIVLKEKAWLDVLRNILKDDNFGFAPHDSSGEVMVEYSSPNTNKPLHLGHLRNNFLGWSVAEILVANGFRVHKVQIINDRGIHICKSMVAWLQFGNGETPTSTGEKGDKLVGRYYVKFDQVYKVQIKELEAIGLTTEQAEKQAPIFLEAQKLLLKWEEKDPKTYDLWSKMNDWVYDGFKSTYDRMQIEFDKLYYESDTYLLGKEEVLKGLKNGIFFQKDDGSIWVDLTDQGLDEKLLLRSDGTSVYMTQDIGTAILRFRDFPKIQRQIYTVGNEQEYHFKVLFAILAKLGFDWAKECYHLSYGMVDLPSGKMKSREGTVVDADDLMEEMVVTAARHTTELGKIEGFSESQAAELHENIGMGALKYFLMKVDPRKRMLFNPEESVEFHGNTGPFIQYTHARIKAILRRASELGVNNSDSALGNISDIHTTEQILIHSISDFPSKVRLAGKDYSPAVVAQYAFDLAKDYNRFYQEVSIFNEADKEKMIFRIQLSNVVAKTIQKAMKLLGINVPERM